MKKDSIERTVPTVRLQVLMDYLEMTLDPKKFTSLASTIQIYCKDFDVNLVHQAYSSKYTKIVPRVDFSYFSKTAAISLFLVERCWVSNNFGGNTYALISKGDTELFLRYHSFFLKLSPLWENLVRHDAKVILWFDELEWLQKIKIGHDFAIEQNGLTPVREWKRLNVVLTIPPSFEKTTNALTVYVGSRGDSKIVRLCIHQAKNSYAEFEFRNIKPKLLLLLKIHRLFELYTRLEESICAIVKKHLVNTELTRNLHSKATFKLTKTGPGRHSFLRGIPTVQNSGPNKNLCSLLILTLYEILKLEMGDPLGSTLGIYFLSFSWVVFVKKVFRVADHKRVTKTQEKAIRDCLATLFGSNFYSFTSTDGSAKSAGIQRLFSEVTYRKKGKQLHLELWISLGVLRLMEGAHFLREDFLQGIFKEGPVEELHLSFLFRAVEAAWSRVRILEFEHPRHSTKKEHEKSQRFFKNCCTILTTQGSILSYEKGKNTYTKTVFTFEYSNTVTERPELTPHDLEDYTYLERYKPLALGPKI